MTTYYWVGGSGNWDATSTTNWASSSGGSGGAGVPTSADDVIFDAGSNIGTGAFTVTITGTSAAPAVCQSFSTGGAGGALDGTMTVSMSATAFIDIYGSLTLPATNLIWTGTAGARASFRSTASGKTITTNGVSLTATQLAFDGVGGDWALGSALTTTAGIFVLNGTFSTANYNVSCTSIQSTGAGTRTISLGSSAVTVTGTTCMLLSGSNLTFTAGTSTITSNNGGAIFNGGGYTFYNVTFIGSTSFTVPITGANTFNNLSLLTPTSGNRRYTFDSNQTINGTFTPGASNTAIRRITLRSDTFGTQRTLTVATLATLADVDFGDIKAAGASAASPWSGTRIGDCGGNNNITFTAAGNKYWYSATGAGGNWSAAQWETTAGGTSPSVNNFPLPQDTVKFQDTGLSAGNTLTIDAAWNLPAIDGTSRTNAMTLASGTQAPTIFGDLTIVSAMTITGTGSWRFSKQGTQNVTTNGVTVTWPVNVENGTGSVKLIDNWTSSNSITLTTGGLDLNDKTATCLTLSSSNSNTRSIAFGTGKIVATGNATTVIGVGVLTNFSYTGTPVIESNYSGSTGTRTINFGQGGGATESNVMTLKISAGSDTVAITTGMSCKTLDTSGFSGTITSGTKQIYADLIVGATTIWAASAVSITFSATSGTQNFTTNGVTIDQSVIVNGGAIVAMIDALTLGSTRTLTLSAGTLKLKNGTTNTVGTWAFSGTVSNPITLQSTTPGSQATISDASGTSNATYLTVQDIVATGGATFNAFTGSGSTTSNNNVNSGNNLGWYFMPPGATFMDFF